MRAALRHRAPAALVCTLAAMVASCSSGDSDAAPAQSAEAHPPVVLIVFDEFSTTSLLDKNRRIDPVRYPNFARLAAGSSWFPYATASLDETGRAMRSLFTGRNTWQFAHPTYADNPRNIFTLLGRRYRVHAAEEVTSMCPRRLCPGVRPQTQRSILHNLAVGRAERLQSWLNGVGPSSRPTFHFKHVLFPHAPWRYLPSGHHYVDPPTQARFSWRLQHFNRWLVDQYYQRHLLQVGETDRLLGKVLDRLKATGLYDRSLVVVTADNGESFGKLGNGHEIRGANLEDIALTPLFVKLPGQQRGTVEARHVRMVDVVPTIGRVAHVGLPWRVDGHSIFGRGARRIPSSTVLIKRDGSRRRLSAGALRRRAAASLRLKLSLFGSGDDPPGLFGVGPYPSMHGTPVSRWPTLPPDGTRAAVDSAGAFRSVSRASGVVPVRVMGHLTGSGARARHDLAVAINDTIAATGPAFPVRRGGTRYFSVMIPESALKEGPNKLQLFSIVRAGTRPQLRALTP